MTFTFNNCEVTHLESVIHTGFEFFQKQFLTEKKAGVKDGSIFFLLETVGVSDLLQ